jgi:hypothetical protein
MARISAALYPRTGLGIQNDAEAAAAAERKVRREDREGREAMLSSRVVRNCNRGAPVTEPSPDPHLTVKTSGRFRAILAIVTRDPQDAGTRSTRWLAAAVAAAVLLGAAALVLGGLPVEAGRRDS